MTARVLSVLLIVLAAGTSCSSGRRVSAENDRLRLRVHELETQVAELEGRNSELAAKLRQQDRPEALSAEILENTPTVVRISLDKRSHARDDDGDGHADHLVLYVVPADGLGRFVQAVGHISAHAAILPAGGEATTIGRLTLGPAAVREAYRSSFMGTHYTLLVPISPPEDLAAATCVAQIEYVDGRTGSRVTDEIGIELKEEP